MKQAAVFANISKLMMTVAMVLQSHACFTALRQQAVKLFISPFRQSKHLIYTFILLPSKT